MLLRPVTPDPGLSRPEPRCRARYAVLAVAVVGAGLLWRSGLVPLAPFAAKYGGDAWWALMVFLGFGVLFPRFSTWRLAILTVGFAWAVEFFQLYRAPWIEAVRATLPGRLILGATFNWPDLPAYVVGVAIGVGGELRFRATSARRSAAGQ